MTISSRTNAGSARSSLGWGPRAGLIKTAATGVAATVTIFVLSFLMVVQGPKLADGILALFPDDRAGHIRAVSAECAKTITGYISGNLLISVICGGLTYAVLVSLGVPFSGLIALFVGVADLIPLVGATLGAVVAALAAFLHSVPAGIIAITFFILYQQLENHLLQPLIFSRTVKLNPLTVLVAILIATAHRRIPAPGLTPCGARDEGRSPTPGRDAAGAAWWPAETGGNVDGA